MEERQVLVVFGAGGRLGAHVVKLASARQDVQPLRTRAVVRNPGKVAFFSGMPNVSVVKGDVTVSIPEWNRNYVSEGH